MRRVSREGLYAPLSPSTVREGCQARPKAMDLGSIPEGVHRFESGPSHPGFHRFFESRYTARWLPNFPGTGMVLKSSMEKYGEKISRISDSEEK